MERRIRSFETLTDELRDKLQEQYPDGIENSHIRNVNTPKGETLRVIELTTPDVMYLIKVNTESREAMDEFLEQDHEGDTDDREGDDRENSDDLEGAEEEEEEEVDKDAPPADDGDEDEE